MRPRGVRHRCHGWITLGWCPTTLRAASPISARPSGDVACTFPIYGAVRQASVERAYGCSGSREEVVPRHVRCRRATPRPCSCVDRVHSARLKRWRCSTQRSNRSTVTPRGRCQAGTAIQGRGWPALACCCHRRRGWSRSRHTAAQPGRPSQSDRRIQMLYRRVGLRHVRPAAQDHRRRPLGKEVDQAKNSTHT